MVSNRTRTQVHTHTYIERSQLYWICKEKSMKNENEQQTAVKRCTF